MEKALTDAGVNEADAKLKVQQLYFKNLELAGTPVAMMQKTLAELATRIELDRIVNPGQDLVDDKYTDLVDLQIKALKTLHSMGDKTITQNVTIRDDREMRAPKFIDVEID